MNYIIILCNSKNWFQYIEIALYTNNVHIYMNPTDTDIFSECYHILTEDDKTFMDLTDIKYYQNIENQNIIPDIDKITDLFFVGKMTPYFDTGENYYHSKISNEMYLNKFTPISATINKTGGTLGPIKRYPTSESSSSNSTRSDTTYVDAELYDLNDDVLAKTSDLTNISPHVTLKLFFRIIIEYDYMYFIQQTKTDKTKTDQTIKHYIVPQLTLIKKIPNKLPLNESFYELLFKWLNFANSAQNTKITKIQANDIFSRIGLTNYSRFMKNLETILSYEYKDNIHGGSLSGSDNRRIVVKRFIDKVFNNADFTNITTYNYKYPIWDKIPEPIISKSDSSEPITPDITSKSDSSEPITSNSSGIELSEIKLSEIELSKPITSEMKTFEINWLGRIVSVHPIHFAVLGNHLTISKLILGRNKLNHITDQMMTDIPIGNSTNALDLLSEQKLFQTYSNENFKTLFHNYNITSKRTYSNFIPRKIEKLKATVKAAANAWNTKKGGKIRKHKKTRKSSRLKKYKYRK